MKAISDLLAQANRIFGEPVEYKPAGLDEWIALNATPESLDIIGYQQDGAATSFRQAAFSLDYADLKTSDGKQVTPKRGDILRAKGVLYKLVEYGGVAWTPRFDAGLTDRILIYFEREKDAED